MPATEHLDHVVGGLREAGQEQALPRGLLARAALRRFTGDPAVARRHLDRARELVEACGYGRRTREVTWLESRLAEIQTPEAGPS